MESPKISVIIPVYNPGRHLIKCLDSVTGQTYKNLEIILIDDGSTDGSGTVCDDYAARDPRIVCVHQPNGGVSKARNRGIELASGDYYHFFDSDDYLEPDAYEYLLKTLLEYDAQAIGFEFFVNYPDREIVHHRAAEHCGLRDTGGAIAEHLFSENDFLCTKLLPASAVLNTRFREDIFRDEDTLFGTMALEQVESAVFIDKPLLHYVQSEESATRGVFRPSQLTAVKVIPIMEPLLKERYPYLLARWRIGYLHLMVMLYCDMALDAANYETEQKEIHDVFCGLYRSVGLKSIPGIKNQVKFGLFRYAPKLFVLVHRIIHSGKL